MAETEDRGRSDRPTRAASLKVLCPTGYGKLQDGDPQGVGGSTPVSLPDARRVRLHQLLRVNPELEARGAWTES
jgi:hypothetical protein